MTEQFTIRVEASFDSAHNLRQYKGAPEPLHGHSWKVEAKYVCSRLDHEDIGIDYVEIEQAIKKLAAKLDHKYINEIAPFDKINPTSENIAKWFFDEMNKIIKSENSKLSEVIVWEGLKAYVSYSCNHATF